MRKIIVIGCPGSGKTAFAEKLQIATNLPLYYLDAIWHKPDKTHISREEHDSILAEIFQTEEWIIDGNYSRTIEERMQNSDTIFLFDLPTEVCLQGATERLGKERYDMPWIDTVLDSKLKQEIEAFPDKMLPRIYELLEKYREGKDVVVFKSREEADRYIESMDLGRNKNRKYYEAYDERYKQIHSMNLEWEADVHSPILDEIISKLELNSKNTILELGCGEGRDAIYLLQKGYEVCATDISKEAIAFCVTKAPQFVDRFMVPNACEDSWSASYDFIYSIAVLHMLVLEEDRDKFLTFVREHLNENGYSLLLTMGDGEMEHASDINTAFDKQERVHVETGSKVSVASTSCRIVSFQTLEKELEKNNLSVVEKGITSIEPGFPVIMYALVKKK